MEMEKLCITQNSQPNDANVAPPSVRKVVDQALVGPSVRELGVVDEDGGTCARHGGHKAHTAVEVVGEAKHLATLVNDHLECDMKRHKVRGHYAIQLRQDHMGEK